MIELASANLAVWDFSKVETYLALGLRVLVTAIAAVIGWWLSGPVCRVFYRLAFQRPAPPTVVNTAKLAGAVVLAVIVFIFFVFGPGGGGGGSGGGTGPGVGPGTGTSTDGTGKKAGIEDTEKKGVATGKTTKPGDVLPIEIIVSASYKKDERWYLINGEKPPSTIGEVEIYLKENRKRLGEIHIIIYSNSPERGHYCIKDLEDLAESYKLPSRKPQKYWTEVRK